MCRKIASLFIMDATVFIPVFVIIRYLVWESLNREEVAFQKLYDFMMPPFCQPNAISCVRECGIVGTAMVLSNL